MEHIFDTIAIIGPGLIGGSIGLGVRSRGLAGRVIGIGRNPVSLREACSVGAVDTFTTDIEAGAGRADAVVIATPVSTFGEIAARLAVCMRRGSLLTEVGSAKETVTEAVSAALGGREDIAFVPTHPMAGSEKRGAAHASSCLFEGAACIFTPLDDTPAEAVKRLKEFWEALGSAVYFMTPQQHDRLVSRISHLPHLVAGALINTIESHEGRYAGGGLIDTTRVASGDPKLWEAICRSNPDRIVEAADCFMETLSEARKFIAEGDFEALGEWFAGAKHKREAILRLRGGGRGDED